MIVLFFNNINAKISTQTEKINDNKDLFNNQRSELLDSLNNVKDTTDENSFYNLLNNNEVEIEFPEDFLSNYDTEIQKLNKLNLDTSIDHIMLTNVFVFKPLFCSCCTILAKEIVKNFGIRVFRPSSEVFQIWISSNKILSTKNFFFPFWLPNHLKCYQIV